jgi:hypothetical protein
MRQTKAKTTNYSVFLSINHCQRQIIHHIRFVGFLSLEFRVGLVIEIGDNDESWESRVGVLRRVFVVEFDTSFDTSFE